MRKKGEERESDKKSGLSWTGTPRRGGRFAATSDKETREGEKQSKTGDRAIVPEHNWPSSAARALSQTSAETNTREV